MDANSGGSIVTIELAVGETKTLQLTGLDSARNAKDIKGLGKLTITNGNSNVATIMLKGKDQLVVTGLQIGTTSFAVMLINEAGQMITTGVAVVVTTPAVTTSLTFELIP